MTAVIDTIIKQRKEQYGDYENMSNVAQGIKDYMKAGENWDNLEPGRAEALELIATKIARIVCGNYTNKDSWQDIAGYAQLGLNNTNFVEYIANVSP